MKCVLHIGSEKTGSTSVQRALYESTAALRAAKIALLPSKDFGGMNNRMVPARFSTLEDDYFVQQGIETQSERRKFNADFDKRFALAIKSIRAGGAEVVIISSEHFHSRLRSKDSRIRLFEYLSFYFDAINAICYFREQGSLLVSHYSEALKHGEKRSLSQWAKNAEPRNYYYNHFMSAAGWAESLEAENLSCFIYEDAVQSKLGVAGHFMEKIGVDAGTRLLSLRANQAFTAGQAAAARLVNNLRPHGCLSATARTIYALPNALITQLPGFSIRSELQIEIASRFSDSNNKFCRTYISEKDAKMVFNERAGNTEAMDYSVIDDIVDVAIACSGGDVVPEQKTPTCDGIARQTGRRAAFETRLMALLTEVARIV